LVIIVGWFYPTLAVVGVFFVGLYEAETTIVFSVND